nr:mevalonate kinase [Candidatus Sigynarchaeota archaeon]
MRTITCTAPGKVILAGEHAVVHGFPAIASAIKMRMEMTMQVLDKPVFELNLGDVGIALRAGTMDELLSKAAVEFPLFKAIYDSVLAEATDGHLKQDRMRNDQGFSITARSTIPVSAGLGSSAGTCVCFIKILSLWLSIPLKEEQLLGLSKNAETLFHSTPSGIDTAAAINGGIFLFEKGKILEQIRNPIELDGDLIIVDTAVQRNTGKMVDSVKALLARDPELVNGRFKAIDAIVRETWTLLKKQKVKVHDLGNLFLRNQRELEAIGVSIPLIHDIIDTGTTHGATGGKLTGAGGGGCVILTCPSRKTRTVMDALARKGLKAFKTEFSSDGLVASSKEGSS